jgi:hypothetical protein
LIKLRLPHQQLVNDNHDLPMSNLPQLNSVFAPSAGFTLRADFNSGGLSSGLGPLGGASENGI